MGFRRIGHAPFGKKKYPLYEWSALQPKQHGAFKARFHAVGDPGRPRRFYHVDLLNDWLGKRTRLRFLDRACLHGYGILAGLESHDAATRDHYRFMHALFRNRTAGHIGIRREFASAKEFVDNDSVDPIIPPWPTSGFDVPGTKHSRGPAKSLIDAAVDSACKQLGIPSLQSVVGERAVSTFEKVINILTAALE